MKTKTIIAIIIYCSINLHSQIIEDFSTWTASGKDAPFDWETPTNWSTTNPLFEFIDSGIKKTTEGATLSTLNVFGENKVSSIVLGEADLSYLQNELHPKGIELDDKLQRVIIDYKFESTTDSDAGSLSLNIIDVNNITKLALEQILVKDNNQLTIEDFGYTSELGDRLLIAFHSTDINDPKAGGVLLLSKIVFDISSDVKDADISNSFTISPNPVSVESGIININQQTESAIDYQLIDLHGKYISQGSIHNKKSTIRLPAGIISGSYILRFNIGGAYVDQRFVVE